MEVKTHVVELTPFFPGTATATVRHEDTARVTIPHSQLRRSRVPSALATGLATKPWRVSRGVVRSELTKGWSRRHVLRSTASLLSAIPDMMTRNTSGLTGLFTATQQAQKISTSTTGPATTSGVQICPAALHLLLIYQSDECYHYHAPPKLCGSSGPTWSRAAAAWAP